MKIKLTNSIIILVLILSNCKQKTVSNQPVNEPQEPTKITIKIDSFFPVTSYLKGQLALLDSTPITPICTTTSNGKTDSSWVKKETLPILLRPFIIDEIDHTNLISLFKETKFNDQTINAITLSYDPIAQPLPDSIHLRQWIVYINPELGKVDKVYMVAHLNEGGKNITQQLTWQANEYAKIVWIENKKNGKDEVIKEQKINWKF